MEHTVPLNFVMWMLGFLASLLGGCWAIFKYFESRLEKNTEELNKKMARVYERMDENKDQYYADFVVKSVYEAEAKLRKENMDGRFERVVELFNEKIESLRSEIRNLVNNGKH